MTKKIRILEILWFLYLAILVMASYTIQEEEDTILYIEEIRYDEGIEEIEDTDDTNLCISLKAVSIPKSMKKIPDGIFDRSKKSVVLTVYPGSFGERYAKKNGYQYQYKEEQNDSVDKRFDCEPDEGKAIGEIPELTNRSGYAGLCPHRRLYRTGKCNDSPGVCQDA